MRFRLLILPPLLLLSACRGDISSSPPVHLNQNMDFQKRFEQQEENPFFADGRAMRPYVEGTVATDLLKIDDHLFRGKKGTNYARELPQKDEHGKALTLNRALLDRGQSRFEIYCAPCHDRTGEGQGMIVKHGMMMPPSLTSERRVLGMPLGNLFEVISLGVRNMPPYAAQIPVRDRWAIAAYVRALQRRRHAGLDAVPPEEAATHGWKKP